MRQNRVKQRKAAAALRRARAINDSGARVLGAAQRVNVEWDVRTRVDSEVRRDALPSNSAQLIPG